ncbi:MAG TPA: YcxB family protein [Pyrinomonadaceae bacterium]|jgi:hypothetical protein
MNDEKLEIEYKVDYRAFRRIWLDWFKTSLPNILAFWGVTILGSLLVLYFLKDKTFGTLLASVFVSIPLLLIILGYQNFMKSAKNSFSMLSETEKIVRLSFESNSDSFESRNGKNYSRIAWESIKSVTELDEFFAFARPAGVFYIPKEAFRDESEIRFLRFLISVNVKKDVKLLEKNPN